MLQYLSYCQFSFVSQLEGWSCNEIKMFLLFFIETEKLRCVIYNLLKWHFENKYNLLAWWWKEGKIFLIPLKCLLGPLSWYMQWRPGKNFKHKCDVKNMAEANISLYYRQTQLFSILKNLFPFQSLWCLLFHMRILWLNTMQS